MYKLEEQSKISWVNSTEYGGILNRDVQKFKVEMDTTDHTASAIYLLH